MTYVTRQFGRSVVEELDRPAPAEARKLTPQEFRRRFTMAEKQAIYGAAQTNALVRCYLDDVTAAQHIDVTDPYTVAGLQALEAAGLIAAGRSAEILAP